MTIHEAWAAYTQRFADPADSVRNSDNTIRDAFEAGWDAALADTTRAASRLREALDVDVLMRAEHTVACDCPGDDSPGCHLSRWAARNRAERVAAEYARIGALAAAYGAALRADQPRPPLDFGEQVVSNAAGERVVERMWHNGVGEEPEMVPDLDVKPPVEDRYHALYSKCRLTHAEHHYPRILALRADQALPHPGEPHEFRATCTRCGERGTVALSILAPNQVLRIEETE